MSDPTHPEWTPEEEAELNLLLEEFELSGGRGVYVADRIDQLRAKRDWDGSLACPVCGSTNLATQETLTGAAGLIRITADEIEWNGRTEMDWDSSETQGIECQDCYWNNIDEEDLRAGLVPSWEVDW